MALRLISFSFCVWNALSENSVTYNVEFSTDDTSSMSDLSTTIDLVSSQTTGLKVMESGALDISSSYNFVSECQNGYGYYIECISNVCEDQSDSKFWFFSINDEAVSLDASIDSLNIKKDDILTANFKQYLESCEDNRPPLENFDILPNSDVTESILGGWFIAAVNNQFYSLFLSFLRCSQFNVTVLEGANNTKILDLAISFCLSFDLVCDSLIEGGSFQYEQINVLDSYASFLAIEGGNASTFPFKILYVLYDEEDESNAIAMVVWGCNDGTTISGLRENVFILTRDTTISDENYQKIEEYLYSLGIPLIQIEMINLQDSTCPHP